MVNTLIAALSIISHSGEVIANRTSTLEILRASRDARSSEIERGARPRIVTQGSTRSRRVALTFDDGPQPETTDKILAILRKRNIRATFFMIGAKVQADMSIARRVLDAGHEIGNHTQMHPNLTKLDPSAVFEEYGSASQLLEETLGISPYLCRPPGGNYDRSVVDQSTALGMTTVLWTSNAADTRLETPADIAKVVLAKAKPGGILLLHDTVELTVEALPLILDGLQKKRLKPGTVGELFGLQP
ncbi:MAG: polysaccharide deacetylase family protein [Chthonomonas sp.]|nr:polysaccharide deacetylase family protein [Chthonomonas sp.]